jgi:hypothetical protein
MFEFRQCMLPCPLAKSRVRTIGVGLSSTRLWRLGRMLSLALETLEYATDSTLLLTGGV